MELVIISCCYERLDLASILVESCSLVGAPLRFCEAAEFGGKWRGSMRVGKMVAALEAVPRLRAEGFTHALWTDGFDSFLRVGVGEVGRRYEALGSPGILFSGEKNCWPDQARESRYPTNDSAFRFINAGGWVAELGYLEDAIKGILVRDADNDDQRLWSEAFVRGYLFGSTIDYGREVFQTFWGTPIEEMRKDSCVFHGNGSDKRLTQFWEEVKNSTVKGSKDK